MKITNNGVILENKKDYNVEGSTFKLKENIKGNIETIHNYIPVVNRKNRRDK